MSEASADEPLIPFLHTFTNATIGPPGRARLFCDQRLGGALPADLRQRAEWPGAGGGLLLAAACGAAVAEQARGGAVLVALPIAALKDPLLLPAASLAVRLSLGAMTLVLVGGAPGDDQALVAIGWRRTGGGPQVRCASAPEPASLPPSLDWRREWPPVRMRTLLPGALPPWPVDSTSLPPAAASDWLAWLAGREADLVVVNLAQGWRDLPPGPATACALGQLAGEGRRVCWRLPSGTDLRPWLDALQHIGRRGLALKLLIQSGDLPARPNLGPLVGWWVLAPADTLEAAAMLAFALDCEDPVLMALPTQVPVTLPPWPARQAYHPGRGRWWCHGATATLVCDVRTLPVVAGAVAALGGDGLAVGVLVCTTVLPVPVGDLDHAGPGPLIACGSDLGIALASAMTDRDVRVEIVTDVGSPDAVVAAVRKVLGR